MRTTILLDDYVARQAKRLAASRGITLSDLVTEALRAALAQPVGAVPPFRMITYGAGEPSCHHEPAELGADQDEVDDRRSLGG